MRDYAKVILVYNMPLTVRETAVYQALETIINGKAVSRVLLRAVDDLCDLYEAKASLTAIEAQETAVELAWAKQVSN